MKRFSPYDQEAKKFHHFSPTLLQEFADCERHVFYSRILKLPQPPFKSQILGTKLHKEAEHLVRTGQDLLHPRLKPIRQYLPDHLPDPKVLAEWGLDWKAKQEGVSYDYARAPKLEGVPLEGYADLIDLRGSVPEITDYKTTSSIEKWAKTPAQLKNNLQLGIYAREVLAQENSSSITVRHLYAQTEGSIFCKEVPAVLALTDVTRIWDRSRELARGLLDLQGRTSDRDIPRTGVAHGHCEAYGGCPFAEVCLESPEALLRLRVKMAEQRNEKRSGASEVPQREENSVSLLDKLNAAKQGTTMTQLKIIDVSITPDPVPKGILPPDAPPNDANAVVEEKKGRKKAVAPPSAPEPQAKASWKLPIKLFVNCIPADGRPYTMLDTYAAQKAAEVSAAMQVPDYRLFEQGAVKGVGGLAALVIKEPPSPGAYVAIAGGFNSPLQVVVDALIPLAEEVTRGVR